MSDITVGASVSRSELGKQDLDIDDGENFILSKSVNVGSASWRREFVTSPFVEGRVPVHEVKDAAESSIAVYCTGPDMSTLQANIQELLEAFTEQYSYELHITANGMQHRWICERADYQVAFATETVLARFVPVQLSFHRKPTPSVGVF